MDEREAQEVTRMVESGWSCDFGMDGRRLWCRMLYDYEAELATQAVVEMSKFPLPGGRFKPHVADLRSIIISLKTRHEEPKRELGGKRGVGPPEWVWVWQWSRLKRVPRESRGFPQQAGYTDPLTMMSQAEYEALRAEWEAAGSPQGDVVLPFARKL